VVALTDRLDHVIGAKAAGPLDEFFGIRTVDDLLRHYPRKYSDGMTVRGEGEGRRPVEALPPQVQRRHDGAR